MIFLPFGLWKVFQVRDDIEPHENFMRNWEDYKVGFGDFDREFWLGNLIKVLNLIFLNETNHFKRPQQGIFFYGL